MSSFDLDVVRRLVALERRLGITEVKERPVVSKAIVDALGVNADTVDGSHAAAIVALNPSVRLYHSANQSINPGPTALTFDTERFDTDSMHEAITNPTRITFTTAGTYIIGANVPFAANATGVRLIQFRHSTIGIIAYMESSAVANAVEAVELVTIRNVAAASYVQVEAYQTSGGALNVTGGANDMPSFWAVRIA